MKLVGLTGGIASGKSTVSRVIREAGVPVVDADEAVHRLEEVGERGWRALYELLGFSVLLADGSLDRVRLARRLFSQSETRRNVNRVLHPLVRQELWREVRELEDTGHRVVVLDIPLLFENGLHHLVDEVWVVWASPEQQLERLMARNGLQEDEARRRLTTQWPLVDKLAGATHVLDNTHGLDELARQVAELLAALRGRKA